MYPCVESCEQEQLPLEEIHVRAVPDAIYLFRGVERSPQAQEEGRGKWLYTPARYRCLGFGTNVTTGYPFVAYRGIDGPDAGQLFSCGLLDWHKNFEAVASAPDELPAGAFTSGS